MHTPSSYRERPPYPFRGLDLSLFLCGLTATILIGCSSGYTPRRAPEPDIDALLAAPQYASIEITHEPDAARTVTTAVSVGNIVMEYLVDDKLVGSHSVYSGFHEVFNLLGGDHELVIQQCYRGVMTLGGRSCQYIKYHFRIRPQERGRVQVVEPNVLRPKTAGFLQWHEIEASRY